MKTKDIANQYGVDRGKFESFLKKSNIKIKDGLMGMTIDDNADVNSILSEFQQYELRQDEELERKKQEAAAEKQKKIQAVADKKMALANMLITSGFSFDGYTITKYSGYISGDDAISVNRGLAYFESGNIKDKLLNSLVEIRRNALAELKESAYTMGCNAVIGVDFDYLILDPQTSTLAGGTIYQPYIFGVTANGNAVVIEKN